MTPSQPEKGKKSANRGMESRETVERDGVETTQLKPFYVPMTGTGQQPMTIMAKDEQDAAKQVDEMVSEKGNDTHKLSEDEMPSHSHESSSESDSSDSNS